MRRMFDKQEIQNDIYSISRSQANSVVNSNGTIQKTKKFLDQIDDVYQGRTTLTEIQKADVYNAKNGFYYCIVPAGTTGITLDSNEFVGAIAFMFENKYAQGQDAAANAEKMQFQLPSSLPVTIRYENNDAAKFTFDGYTTAYGLAKLSGGPGNYSIRTDSIYLTVKNVASPSASYKTRTCVIIWILPNKTVEISVTSTSI